MENWYHLDCIGYIGFICTYRFGWYFKLCCLVLLCKIRMRILMNSRISCSCIFWGTVKKLHSQTYSGESSTWPTGKSSLGGVTYCMIKSMTNFFWFYSDKFYDANVCVCRDGLGYMRKDSSPNLSHSNSIPRILPTQTQSHDIQIQDLLCWSWSTLFSN